MRKFLALLAAVALIGCASTPAPTNPAEICQAINPNPNMYISVDPVSVGEGVRIGSPRTEVKGGRCEFSAAVYVDSEPVISEFMQRQDISRSEAERLVRSDEYHERMIEHATGSAQEAADQYPPGTMRFKYQYMPTRPMRPFLITVEN